jgi:hypothetical protein
MGQTVVEFDLPDSAREIREAALPDSPRSASSGARGRVPSLTCALSSPRLSICGSKET